MKLRSLSNARQVAAQCRDDLRFAIRALNDSQREVDRCKKALADAEKAVEAMSRFQVSACASLKDIAAVNPRAAGSPVERLEQAKHLLTVMGATFYNDRSRKGRSLKVQYWPGERSTARLLNRALTRLADAVNDHRAGKFYRGSAQPLDGIVRRYHFYTAAGDAAHEAKNEELRAKAVKARKAAKRRAARAAKGNW